MSWGPGGRPTDMERRERERVRRRERERVRRQRSRRESSLQGELEARAERKAAMRAAMVGPLDVERLESALLRHPEMLTELTRRLDGKYIRPWDMDPLEEYQERLTLLGRQVARVSASGGRWRWSVVCSPVARHGISESLGEAQVIVDKVLLELGWVLG